MSIQPTTPFSAPFWLKRPMLQTMMQIQRLGRRYEPVLAEHLALSDGDVLDIYTLGNCERQPYVVLVPGLTANVDVPYLRCLMQALLREGYASVCLSLRGMGRQPNRLPVCFDAGKTQDLHEAIAHVTQRYPRWKPAVMGFSIGGNLLLKWLGEQGGSVPVAGGIAINAPNDLNRTVEHLGQDAPAVYQAGLVRLCVDFVSQNEQALAQLSMTPQEARRIRTFADFHQQIAGPLLGAEDMGAYLTNASCKPWVSSITCPTLIIQDLHDPIVPADTALRAEDVPDNVCIMNTMHGGHIGYVASDKARPYFWLHTCLPEVLAQMDMEA